jgi:hypothetical protein
VAHVLALQNANNSQAVATSFIAGQNSANAAQFNTLPSSLNPITVNPIPPSSDTNFSDSSNFFTGSTSGASNFFNDTSMIGFTG